MTRLLFPELTYHLRGVCSGIHNEPHAGHVEADYENALAIALEQDGVPFRLPALCYNDQSHSVS